MIIELEMLHEKIARVPGFPEELKVLLEHLIISHHGEYEFGSPKLPMFPEALMLHYMDDLDSKMESMRAQFEREAEFDSPWTSYNPSLARPLLNPKKFIEKGLVNSRLVEVPKAVVAAAAGPVVAPSNSGDNPAERTQNAGANAEELEPGSASAGEAHEKQSSSPLEALQRKFESHKVMPSKAAEKVR
jgi:3'-5' exoribonuclease